MIDSALELLGSSIHNYLVQLFQLPSGTNTIKLNGIVDAEGILTIPIESLGMTLVNVEEERVVKAQKAVHKSNEGNYSTVNPEIKLNLYILITANFTQYTTSLKYLSGVIRFFQSKNVFNQQNSPSMPSTIEKLIVDLYTLNLEQQNHLWGSLGAKYMPSVLYRVRMITVQENLITAELPPVKEIRSENEGM